MPMDLMNATGQPLIRVARDMDGLARVMAERLVDALQFRLKDEWVSVAHVVLPGGALTETLLETLADGHAKRRVEWDRVHVWWSDERYLGEGHIGRHETHARAAGLLRIGIHEDHIHPYPCPEFEDESRPDLGAEEYAKLLRKFAPVVRRVPLFDIVMLDVGRVGEVAALYPGHELLSATTPVVPVWDALQAPPLRMTMTIPALSSATRVWLLASGTERAVAVGRSLQDADPQVTPAAGVKGVLETIWWLDEKAARAVPKHLRWGGEASTEDTATQAGS